MIDQPKRSALALIQSNIQKCGHHVYLVSAEAVPRFSYTIGLSKIIGGELLMAGGSTFSANDVERILNAISAAVTTQAHWQQLTFQVEEMGSFTLRKVDPSWANDLMLGVLDFYGTQEVSAWQVLPDRDHWTIDVPDSTEPWDAAKEPVWRWLREPWGYSVPLRSVATTNLGALRGDRITEAARWESDQWELFAGAGPDVPYEDVRVVPLATLLAIDDSLATVTTLEVGQALWRDATESEWHPWGR